MQGAKNESLAGIRLFDGLSESALEDLSKRCRWHKYQPNEQVIDRFSDSRDLYLIVKGRVRVVNYSVTGREVTFDEREEGEYFGELAALDGEPRSANVIALNELNVACLSQEAFNRLLLEHPQVTLKILHGLAKIVRASNKRIMDLSTVGANNRVHAEILRLALPGVRTDNTAIVSPFPIHGDIASRVSTTRETVNRVFSDLSRRGIVKRSKSNLVILDLIRLRKMIEDVVGEIN
ncbi:MAG: CRP-like cAMP-activated global transcriptional regulator [Alphaproteobacteria bacterium MarineAlpha3_Bin6]|nr:MAG: CRP-like cAMP-activated global transcriptional regulator [Alphaproteobacteria bacterium MarineAlpha3_Bin6]|tara:strand:+ start:45 stop:749 length:705 start_codon:yes stop_codon:yes gene_type:complete